MAGYLALPNELKNAIELSQQDLSRLSRTSKSMHKAILPQLYKCISLKWEAFKAPPRISALLQACMRSLGTAKHVQELRFYGKGYRERIDNPERKLRPTQKNVPQYIFEPKPKADRAITGSKPLLEKAMRDMRLSDNERKLVL